MSVAISSCLSYMGTKERQQVFRTGARSSSPKEPRIMATKKAAPAKETAKATTKAAKPAKPAKSPKAKPATKSPKAKPAAKK